MSRPVLSIVVIFHNMVREAERTLFTLSPDYQLDVTKNDYEVIAIDNGSTQPLTSENVRSFGDNFQYHYLETSSVSPAAGVNLGARLAKGAFLAIIIDGARMVTPGIVATSLKALRAFSNPLVGGLAWHLGFDIQNRSMLQGYDQEEEDRLLAPIIHQAPLMSNWHG